MSISGTLARGTLAAAPSFLPSTHSPPPLLRDELDLRVDRHAAFWAGQAVPLTRTEFAMVRLMAQRPDALVTYRDLYDLVHGPGFMAGKGASGYRANVRAFIKRIRKKFRDIDDGFDAIVNEPGKGYRWREITGTPAP